MMIAGITVLYNPTIEVLDNINSYARYVETLFVYDNSNVPNELIVEKLKSMPNVKYIGENKNNGIATALNRGCEEAYAQGYEWILTMDQDSIFENGDFFKNFFSSKDQNVGIYAASYTKNFDRWVRPFNNLFNEIHFVVTSGNLLSLSAWKAVGGFMDKLFIDEVDHDFCIKLRKKGFRILTSIDILMHHSVGLPLTAANGKTFEGHSPIRYYYITRNMLYLTKAHIFNDPGLVLNRWRHNSKNYIKILMHYPDKKNYIKNISKGFFDFLTGNYGVIGNKN